MKKIGIVTMSGYFNYGNRFQNYALQETLKSLNCQVETIVNIPTIQSSSRRLGFVNRLKRVLRMPHPMVANKLKRKMIERIKPVAKVRINDEIDYELFNYNHRRYDIFKKFSDEYIKETPFIVTSDSVPPDLADKYDYLIAGSDQVWNPLLLHGLPIHFLTFAPKHKRVAYAASFGISDLPDEYVINYRKWLSEMAFLSVRENEGAIIVKNLTGRTAAVHPDPTLLLSKSQWLDISDTDIKKPSKDYLLVFMMGEVSDEVSLFINEFANYNMLEIVNLAHIKPKPYFLTSPSEFIDYINFASTIFTDSYHGAIFSIIFEKPFIIFDRVDNMPAMHSRIDTLLSTFCLQHRRWEATKTTEDVFECEYSHIPAILVNEKARALQYLKLALNLETIN